MAMKDAVKNLLKCPICMEEFREPKTLHCNHSFCKRCLANSLKSKYLKKDGRLQAPVAKAAIVCPTCKAVSQEFHSLDELGTSHIIITLLDVQVKERGDELNRSFPCSCGKAAKVYCYRCSGSCCLDCFEKQKGQHCAVRDSDLAGFIHKGVMKHVFVKIPSEENDFDCIEHSLSLDLFCNDCKQTICMDCLLLNHRHHQTRPIKYAREEALALVDKIKSTRIQNADVFEQLHQMALDVSKNAIANEEKIIDQIANSERRIHGLISSLFKKIVLFYQCNAGMKKTTAEAALHYYESSKFSHSNCAFKDKTDFELACLVNDLLVVEDTVQKETNGIDRNIQAIRKSKSERSLELLINQEAIFNLILAICEHFQFGGQNPTKYVSEYFSFEDYLNGKYLGNIEKQKVSKASDGHVVTSRENQHTAISNIRPQFPIPSACYPPIVPQGQAMPQIPSNAIYYVPMAGQPGGHVYPTFNNPLSGGPFRRPPSSGAPPVYFESQNVQANLADTMMRALSSLRK